MEGKDIQAKITIIVFYAVLWCGGAQAAQFTVFGVDRTESYDVITQTAIAIASGVLVTAKPDDEVVVRWISGQSYRPDQIISHLKVPADKLANVDSGYNRKIKRQQKRLENKRKALQKKTIFALQRLCVGATKRTDIFGFVAAAAEQFSVVPPDVEKNMILATDLGDNRHYKADIDLQGVKVLIYLLNTSANPAKVKDLRDRWTTMFKKWGASAIQFRWPSPRQIQWSNKQCNR